MPIYSATVETTVDLPDEDGAFPLVDLDCRVTVEGDAETWSIADVEIQAFWPSKIRQRRPSHSAYKPFTAAPFWQAVKLAIVTVLQHDPSFPEKALAALAEAEAGYREQVAFDRAEARAA